MLVTQASKVWEEACDLLCPCHDVDFLSSQQVTAPAALGLISSNYKTNGGLNNG